MPDPIVNTQPSLVLSQYIERFGIFPSRDREGNEGNHMGMIHTFASPTNLTDNFSAVDFANGAFVSINSNTALFALLGTNFGGNGTTNYQLPNLVGRAAVDDGQGPGLSDFILGETFGQSGATLSLSQLPASLGGASTAIDNHQPSLALNFYINAEGIFPNRDGGGATTGLIGQVFQAAQNFPVGIPCDGRLLPIAQYEALFAVIGTIYGGDGQTTFAVPDLRGRTIIGTGNGFDVGETVGSENVTIAQANLPLNMGGSGAPVNNQQPGLVLNTMVALTGIFQGFGDFNPGVAEVIYFAGNFVPGGYAAAQGQLLPINQNQALFSLMGTTFGGDGANNFALPNLAGRTIVGTDNAAGSPATGTIFGDATIAITSAMIPSLNLNGTPDADTLFGGDSADTLNGQNSDDRLTGNGGADQLNGGAGNDTASYQFNTGAVYAELNINLTFETALTAGTVLASTARVSQDNLNAIENVTGSAFGDRIYGDGLDNVITPGAGNDIVYAEGGIDTLDYASAAGAVFADIAASTILETGLTMGTVSAGTALLSTDYTFGFENLNGSAFGDRLYGTAAVNVINGNNGADYIYGGAGADILNGGIGDDLIIGEAGADVMTGGTGADRFFFSTPTEAAIDSITDFTAGSDQLWFLRSAIGLGPAAPLNLVVNGAAGTADGTFLYNSASGLLSFDADGSSAGAAVGVANIGTGLALTVADIVLYA